MADLIKLNWDNVVSPERNELVFANRFKEYGAYPIRTSYRKTTAIALIASVVLFSLFVSAPVIINYFTANDNAAANSNIEVTVELKEPPPIDENEPPPPPPPPPPPTIETVKFTPPVVVDREIEEEQPPPQEKLAETTVSTVTQEGEEGGTEPLPEAVVEDPNANAVLTIVEEMPTFPGGEGELQTYLKKNIKYPPLARENGITGRVYVNFIVDREGKIKDAKILRGIGGGCDEEALRVVRSMPSWKPGKQNGRSVNVSFNMPIFFNLQ
ncbi:MAG: energy transducer TonB [Bacteroidota bacterium]